MMDVYVPNSKTWPFEPIVKAILISLCVQEHNDLIWFVKTWDSMFLKHIHIKTLLVPGQDTNFSSKKPITVNELNL